MPSFSCFFWHWESTIAARWWSTLEVCWYGIGTCCCLGRFSWRLVVDHWLREYRPSAVIVLNSEGWSSLCLWNSRQCFVGRYSEITHQIGHDCLNLEVFPQNSAWVWMGLDSQTAFLHMKRNRSSQKHPVVSIPFGADCIDRIGWAMSASKRWNDENDFSSPTGSETGWTRSASRLQNRVETEAYMLERLDAHTHTYRNTGKYIDIHKPFKKLLSFPSQPDCIDALHHFIGKFWSKTV